MRRFAFYFPLGDCPENRVHLMQRIEDDICRRAGGLTSHPAVGLYAKPDGTLERDKIQVLEIFVAETAAEAFEGNLRRQAAALAAELEEDSVAYSVDGQMHFVNAR